MLTGVLVVAPHTLWSWMGNKVILEKKESGKREKKKPTYIVRVCHENLIPCLQTKDETFTS